MYGSDSAEPSPATRSQMNALSGLEVFAAGGDVYRLEDVLAAAELRGDWSRVEERARENLALILFAEQNEEAGVAEESIDEAAAEFRYERDLITSEEMESWLARWELDADSWLDWIHASLLRKRLAEGVVLPDPEADAEELDLAVRAEAVCSRDLERFARRLAARVAIGEREKEFSMSGDDPGRGGLTTLNRSEALASLEQSFQRFREQVVTPAALSARIAEHRTDWTRVDCHVARLADEGAAREAAIAVRQDGADLARVVAEIGQDTEDGIVFLDEMEPEIRDALLSARRGELVGPARIGDEFVLVHVLNKIPPVPDDPEVRERAESSLIESLVSHEIDNRITWRWRS
jgi:hypothetical protein